MGRSLNTPLARLFLMFLALGAVVPHSFSQNRSPKFVKDELLVKFKTAANVSSVERTLNSHRLKRLEKLGDLGWHRVKLPPGLPVEKAIQRLKLDLSIAAVQPNYYYSIQATPNDPVFNVPPPDHMYGLVKISAPQAWDVATGSSSVVVAVIDTGVKYIHEDLAANIWVNPGEVPGNGIDDDGNGFIDDVHGYDFQNNDGDPADDHGHGTHTSGTIGAAGNNGIGVVGVNWNVRLMAIKVLSSAATDGTSAILINAYNYVRMMRKRGVNIRVTNNSYGGCDKVCEYDQAVKDGIDAMGDAGVLNVFAAGNANVSIDTAPFYPASFDSPSIVSVAASTSTDDKALFSSYGVDGVDLAAPGLHIISTWTSEMFKYNFQSGTSMSAPHVAGAAALLSSVDPSLSAASLKASILNTVDPIPQWNGLVRTGGRLNVSNALKNQTVCSLVLESASVRASTKGGLYKINVAAPPNCAYAVKSNSVWTVVTGPGVRSGNTELAIRVRVNDTIRRSAAVKVGDQTVTVSQSRDGG